MVNNINRFTKNLNLFPGVSLESINAFESKIQVKFPKDYKEFLTNSNGGEGFVGDSYLLLYSLEDIEEIYQLNIADEYVPGLISFGSNGGGETYAFDTRQPSLSIVEFPAIGVDDENIRLCGYTFFEFLEYVFNLHQKRKENSSW